MNYKLFFPTPLCDINDIYNDNIDVCVKLDDGNEFVLVVATPQNLINQMKNDNVPFIKPGLPFIIVESLTEKNIKIMLDEYLKEDDQYLKIYGQDLSSF